MQLAPMKKLIEALLHNPCQHRSFLARVKAQKKRAQIHYLQIYQTSRAIHLEEFSVRNPVSRSDLNCLLVTLQL